MTTDTLHAEFIAQARRFTESVPLQHLLRHGAFPDGWVPEYLAFVKRATDFFDGAAPVPREVLAAAYVASVYCTKRYYDWQGLTGGENKTTRSLLNDIRWAGDFLVLGSHFPPPAQSPA